MVLFWHSIGWEELAWRQDECFFEAIGCHNSARQAISNDGNFETQDIVYRMAAGVNLDIC